MTWQFLAFLLLKLFSSILWCSTWHLGCFSASGQGSSLIICIGILKGYSETLLKMLMNLQRRFPHTYDLWVSPAIRKAICGLLKLLLIGYSLHSIAVMRCLSYDIYEWWLSHDFCVITGGSTGWGPSIFVFLGVFLVITMWAVLVTEGRRKIKMVYYNFELAPTKAYVLSLTPYVHHSLKCGDVLFNDSVCEVSGCSLFSLFLFGQRVVSLCTTVGSKSAYS